MAEPPFESPVSTPGPTGAALTLIDESASPKLVVRRFPDGPDGPDVAFGRAAPVGGALVVGIRPDEWWVLGDGNVDMDPALTMVDLTHGRAQFRLTGPAATTALETVCSLDWSDPMMPNGAATSASVAKVICDVVRDDRDGVASYLLLVDRSFAQYLFDALRDAAGQPSLR
ncbi:MAG: hypothetical protein GY713_03515 [Actinomycetia bacterium]|nr:hypothetical protein [Actinomycetes bacterium]